jgi:hypothetical protein
MELIRGSEHTNSEDPCDDWADHPIPKPKDNKENKDVHASIR